MAEWGCGGYAECPCGCGWAMCVVYGSFVTPEDCSRCRYNKRVDEDGAGGDVETVEENDESVD